MATITLSVKDRLILGPLLPVKGGRIEMMLIDALAREVEFTPEDISLFELRDTPAGVSGNAAKFADKVIELSAEQVRLIKELPARLDKQGQVTREMLPLLDKIDAL